MEQGEKQSRSEQAKRTRRLIFDTAKSLFDRYGLEDVSVDDIVRRANVAKGSFYSHFESRDALIAELISKEVTAVDEDYIQFMEGLPLNLSLDEIILTLIDRISMVLSEQIGVVKMRYLFRVQLGQDQQKIVTISYQRSLFVALMALLERWSQENNLVDAITAKSLTKQFFMLYRGLIYEWCMHYPDFDLRTEALELFTLIMEGIKIKYRNIEIRGINLS